MASSSSKDEKILIYDALNFSTYYESLLSKCHKKQAASHVLSEITKDPIASFRIYFETEKFQSDSTTLKTPQISTTENAESKTNYPD